MEYKITLVESVEGFSASCPMLKGCHSQGMTKEETLSNIRVAIEEWLGTGPNEEVNIQVSSETTVM